MWSKYEASLARSRSYASRLFWRYVGRIRPSPVTSTRFPGSVRSWVVRKKSTVRVHSSPAGTSGSQGRASSSRNASSGLPMSCTSPSGSSGSSAPRWESARANAAVRQEFGLVRHPPPPPLQPTAAQQGEQATYASARFLPAGHKNRRMRTIIRIVARLFEAAEAGRRSDDRDRDQLARFDRGMRAHCGVFGVFPCFRRSRSAT